MVSDEEVISTFHVMCQLRPHLGEGGYVERIRGVRQGGYRLAAVVDEGQVRCVTGFRIQDYLCCGKLLYVDDLVTDEGSRSKSYGKLMLDWLIGEAEERVRAVSPGLRGSEARHPQVLLPRGDEDLVLPLLEDVVVKPAPNALSGWGIDHRLKEVFERFFRVGGEAGVDGGGLHNGAAGRY